MSTQVSRPMFVNYYSLFAPRCYPVIVDNSGLSNLVNDGSECSVGKNTIFIEAGDASATVSSDVLALDSGSSSNVTVTWSDFVERVDNNRSIEHETMSSESGTAEASVDVFKSKIPVELENGK